MRTMTRRAAFPVVIGALLASVGCGYGFGAGRVTLPPGAEKIFVRPFENMTGDAETGAFLASELRQELARSGHLGDAGSDARIEGEIALSSFTNIGIKGETWSQTLGIRARLVVSGKTISTKSLERSEPYLGAIDPLETEGRRRLALRRLASALARDLIEQFQSF